MPHFFTTDLSNLFLGLLLGGILIVFPGYLVGHALNPLSFRTQPTVSRWSLSILFGLSCIPIVLYLFFRFLSSAAMFAELLTLSLAGFSIIFRKKAWLRWGEIPLAARIAGASCLVLGIIFLLDISVGSRLYPSWSVVDQSARTAMTVQLEHATKLPTIDPLYAPGHTTQLRYHYFLFLFSAAIAHLSAGLVPARIALSAITIWSGVALFACVSAFIDFFGKFNNKLVAKRIAWFLVAVTGLDCIPVLAHMIFERAAGRHDFVYLSDVEWWNGAGNVSGWIDSIVWGPHHLAAMIACLVGCLVLWHSLDTDGWKLRLSLVTAALAFASAAGFSMLLVIPFAVFLLLVALELLLNHPRKAIPLILAGLVALVLAAPFILEMQPPPGEPSPVVSAIMLRQFQPLTDLYLALGVKSLWVWNLSYILALPLNYFLELGIFFLCAIWWCWDRRHSQAKPDIRDHLTAGLLLVTLFLTCFFRFGVSFSNDFGSRGMLPAQFVLLIWAAEFGERHWPSLWNKPRTALTRAALALVVLGILSNALGLILLRGRFVFAEKGMAPLDVFSGYGNAGERLADARLVYNTIRRETPNTAVVQENPVHGQTYMQSQYSERRTSIYFPMDILPADALDTQYKPAFDQIRSLFEQHATNSQMNTTCQNLGINYVVAQDNDPVWAAPGSFVWTSQPTFSTSRVRVFKCPI